MSSGWKLLCLLSVLGWPVINCDRNPECYQRLDIGQWCGQTVPLQQYYFEPGTGVCHPFQWNRCGGNENRFETYEKCMERCDPLTHPKPTDPFCEVPANSGVPNSVFGYRASFRYYFNTTYGNCYTFYYYGVGGNDNIYDTEQDCRRRCDRTYEGYLKDAPTPAENPFCGEHQIYQSVTQKPFSNCKNETNFYYDKPINECLPFEGCKNDRNRFFTKAVCEKNCKV